MLESRWLLGTWNFGDASRNHKTLHESARDSSKQPTAIRNVKADGATNS